MLVAAKYAPFQPQIVPTITLSVSAMAVTGTLQEGPAIRFQPAFKEISDVVRGVPEISTDSSAGKLSQYPAPGLKCVSA